MKISSSPNIISGGLQACVGGWVYAWVAMLECTPPCVVLFFLTYTLLGAYRMGSANDTAWVYGECECVILEAGRQDTRLRERQDMNLHEGQDGFSHRTNFNIRLALRRLRHPMALLSAG